MVFFGGVAIPLGDLTDWDAVLNAIAEFDRLGRDRFLAEHGFGRARSYFLRYNDRDYDSKAVVGVAHGYQFPTLGPLSAADFSGGEATVAQLLRGLDFEVVQRGEQADEVMGSGRRNPTWAFDELALALDLYLYLYLRESQLDDSDVRVVELSEPLNRLPIHTVPLR